MKYSKCCQESFLFCALYTCGRKGIYEKERGIRYCNSHKKHRCKKPFDNIKV